MLGLRFALLLCLPAAPLAAEMRWAQSGMDDSAGKGGAAAIQQSGLDDRIDALIDQLGSPNFQDREQATEMLKAQGKSLLPMLKSRYLTTSDLEVRTRLREIAEKIIYREELSGLGGFLGIRPSPVESDPRVGEGRVAVEVKQVVANSSAEMAGIELGDLIFEVDGQPLTFDPKDGEGFARLIRAQQVGQVMRFTLFRGDQRMTKEVVLGVRPIEHATNQNNAGTIAWREQVARLLNKAEREFEQWSSGLESGQD